MALVVDRLRIVGSGRKVLADAPGFRVEAGRITALLGPSGAGKSLCALTLLGLLPEGITATAETLRCDDLDLTDPAACRAARGRRVGLVFQDPRMALHPSLPVGMTFVDALRASAGSEKAARSEALRWLAAVGLDSPEKRFAARPHEFSGGELQRVLIALALSLGPRYLVADEPTSHLDVETQGRILGLLRRMVRERSLGLLLITHDPRVVAAMADDVVRIEAAAGCGA